jgi:hypothetical protein
MKFKNPKSLAIWQWFMARLPPYSEKEKSL